VGLAGPQSARPAAAPRFAAVLRHSRAILLPLAFAGVMLAAWQGLTAWQSIPTVILPSPAQVLTLLFKIYPALLDHGLQTTTEIVLSFAIGALVGVALAVAVVSSQWVKEALYPNLVFFQLIPKIAMAPLFVVWFGIGGGARLAFSVFITFFPIFIAAADGLLNVDRDLVRLCRGLTASKWQIFAIIRFPHAVPAIFSGMKIGITMAVIGVIVGEFIVAQKGLGYLVLFAASRADTPLIFASIAMLCAIGLGLFGLVALAEHVALKWYGA
jgi:NitT/TauT family transport system permease protein